MLREFLHNYGSIHGVHHSAVLDDGMDYGSSEVEGNQSFVCHDDRFHGYSVSGSDDPAGVHLWRYAGNSEPPADTDLHACGLLPVYGDIHVPRCYSHQRADCTGGGRTIDGCSSWQIYWKIVFPMLKPTIATVAIIDAMAFWNDYLLPSLILGRKELYTLPIATQVFYGTFSTDIGLIMAALLLAMLPILILYLFLQRYIVEGVTAGAVK